MQSRRWRRFGWLGLVAAAMSFLVGCAGSPRCLDNALLVNRDPAAHGVNLPEQYVVHCPDVLEVAIAGHPEWSGSRLVDADGRIGLTERAYLRVAGQTTAEAAKTLERLAAVPPGAAGIHVAEFRSQQLYLFSDVPGLQCVVPYQGPETIVDLLQRVGGISSRCAPTEIQVVRAHVADGGPAEIFHVDLAAILLRQDHRTNVTLRSFDQIYLGQSRQSAVLNCCPPWLKPFYKKCCGITRREKSSQQTKDLLRDEDSLP